jgi:hypothetical protein
MFLPSQWQNGMTRKSHSIVSFSAQQLPVHIPSNDAMSLPLYADVILTSRIAMKLSYTDRAPR